MINHVSQLERSSTWRIYQRGLRELTLLEAPQSVLKDFQHQAARTCFLAFADLMMDGNLTVAPFHELIASAFEDLANGEYPRLIVSCAPRSGKSLLSQLFVSWLIGKEDKNSHIIGSYSKGLSGKFHKGILAFCRHREFSKVFPDFRGFEPDSKFALRGGGELLACSPGSALTGFSAGSWSVNSSTVGAMVIDDPLKSSNSAAALRQLESWWGEEASTRKTNRFCQVVIATRFHIRDLHGLLLDSDGHYDPETNPDGWRWLNIPALCEDPENDPLGRQVGESHWADHPIFTPEKLLAQKRSMGDDNRFAALYQGQPTAADGSLCKRDWIRTIDKESVPHLDFIWMACDTAFSENENADESALCIAGSAKGDNRIFILDILHGNWDFPDLLDIVQQVKTLYKVKVLAIEKAASGYSLIQMLKRKTKTQVAEMRPIRSKVQRLQQALPLFRAGQVYLVRGEWTDDFIKELLSFPVVPHDDRTDSLVWALLYYAIHIESESPTRGEGKLRTLPSKKSFIVRTSLQGMFDPRRKSGSRFDLYP